MPSTPRTLIDKGDYMPPRGPEVAAVLDADPDISHVVVVHCETSSGILNPLKEISEAVYARGRKLLVFRQGKRPAAVLGVNSAGEERLPDPPPAITAPGQARCQVSKQ